jgi:hypothetical protein
MNVLAAAMILAIVSDGTVGVVRLMRKAVR